MLIPLAVSCLSLILAPTDSSESAVVTMDPEIARARITQSMAPGVTLDKRLEMLLEVRDRCEEPDLFAAASLNLGTLYLGLIEEHPERYTDAINAFREADERGISAPIRVRARYNLGHTHHTMAKSMSSGLSPEAMQDVDELLTALKNQVAILRSSAGAFRSVMELDRLDQQAASNTERVRQQIKLLQDQIDAIEQMIEDEKQRQKVEQQQQQEQADKLKELAEQQQSEADETQSSPPKDEQEAEKQKSDQTELCTETESTQEDITQQNDADKAKQVMEKIEEAKEAQEKAQQAMDEGDMKEAGEQQEKAAQSLKEAADAMQALADESKSQGEGQGDQSGEEGQPQDEGDPQSNENQESEQAESDEEGGDSDQIDEIAKQLLDKERREREAREAYKASGRPTKVKKDW